MSGGQGDIQTSQAQQITVAAQHQQQQPVSVQHFQPDTVSGTAVSDIGQQIHAQMHQQNININPASGPT